MTYGPRLAGIPGTATVVTVLAASAVVTPAAAVVGTDELFVVADPEIREASGLALGADARALFLVQDAGNPAEVVGLDDEGRTRLLVDVPVENEDWEDLAAGTDPSGRPVLYVADTGDAWVPRHEAGEPARTSFRLVRLAQPHVPSSGAPAEVDAEDVRVFPLRYADGAARNAEALAVEPTTGRVYVVDKVGQARTPRLWVAPDELLEGQENDLTPVGRLPVPSASGAAFSPDGGLLVVRDATTAHVWPVSDGDVATAVAQPPVEVPLPEQEQGESIAVSRDGASLLVGSEGSRSPVYRVPLPAGLAATRPSADPSPPTGTDVAVAPSGTTPPWPWAAATALVAGALVAVMAAAVRRSRRSR